MLAGKLSKSFTTWRALPLSNRVQKVWQLKRRHERRMVCAAAVCAALSYAVHLASHEPIEDAFS